MKHFRSFTLAVAGFCLISLAASPLLSAAEAEVQKQPGGIQLQVPGGLLQLQVLSDTVIRVAYAKDASFFTRPSIDVIPHVAQASGWKVATTARTVTLSTAKIQARIDRTSGAVAFFTAQGEAILSEADGGRKLDAASVMGENTFHAQQKWSSHPDESLYGLGQMQLGIVDIKGYDIDMWQHNTNVVVPFVLSSKGYGVFWDNTSFTRFGDLRPFVPVPAENLLDSKGAKGGLTVTPVDGSTAPQQTANIGIVRRMRTPNTTGNPAARPAPPKNMRWEGEIEAPSTGDYQFKTYSNGGIKVWFDSKLIISHWRQGWLTSDDQVKIHLEAKHRYPVKIETDAEQQSELSFQWKTPPANDEISLWSEVGDGVDYYFLYGPKLDNVIAGYRMLTGKATMMPSWVFGLWQSRQRYETAEQSLDVVKQFRSRQIPFDNIVQDWQYWRPDSWGSHAFDPSRFPDPEGWIKAIHAEHAHLMISVWGKFNPNTDNAKEMNAKGFLYQPNIKEGIKDWIGYPYTFYDAFNPDARKLFWLQIDKRLFSKGVDAWWMDATEPDLLPSPPTLEGQEKYMNPTAMGSGARMVNGYALVNSQGVYTGERASAPDQRVFILTRSGFAGQQRYSAATWSGDITSTWTAMAKQIPAGLGMSISGVPYWTMDTGGYTMQRRFSRDTMKPEDQDEWRELNARWFEFSTFTPLLRVHGELRHREMWTMGDEASPAYQAELKFDRLRYAMFPYIYSEAGAITQHDETMMRPLVMDFPGDRRARELTDEYMFGPAFLVAPITAYKDRSRSVYLPEGTSWYDFWTGKTAHSGEQAKVDAPYDSIPVFVRAGSIIPFGPDVQYISEKPSDPTTLYVYQGANGEFTMYEDQGTNFAYEKGAFAEIPMRWNETAKTLVIGKRSGSFDGMLQHRTFQIVLVSSAHPSGFSPTTVALKTVQYEGEAVSVKLQ